MMHKQVYIISIGGKCPTLGGKCPGRELSGGKCPEGNFRTPNK